MRKLIRFAGLFLLFAGLMCMRGHTVAQADVYDNITYRETRGNAAVIQDVYKCGNVLFVPQYIEGKLVIGWRLDSSYKQVKELILPRYFKVESKYFHYYRSNNPLSFFPNLENLTFSAESKYLQVYGGGLYSKDLTTLYAVLPYATELTMPKETKEIRKDALDTGAKIKKIRVAKGNTSYRASGNILYSADGKELIWAAPKGISKVCTVPGGIEKILSEAFKDNTKLRELRLPAGIDVIEESAFEDCVNLRTVKFGKNLRLIEEYAFYNCRSLQAVELPEGLDTVEEDAFYKCRSIRKISIPQSLDVWDDYISNESLQELKIYGGFSDGYFKYYVDYCMRGKKKKFTIYAKEGSDVWNYVKEKKEKKKLENVHLKTLPGKAKPAAVDTLTGRVDHSWYKEGAKKLTISTPAQFASFLEMDGYEYNLSKKQIVLTKDIDMKGYRGLSGIDEFDGELDGRGHHVRNLTIYEPGKEDIGVIRELNGNGVVKNLNVHGVITGGSYVGGIVGVMTDNASLSNCHFYGTVKGKTQVGGIAGGVYANELVTVKQCVNHGKVAGNYFVGGILGRLKDTLTQVWENRNRGSVKAIRYGHKRYCLAESYLWEDEWLDWWDDEW